MDQPIIRKLHRFGKLHPADAEAVDRLLHDCRFHSPHREIVRLGDKPSFALAILSGWAIRYRVVKDGGRQITAFLMPGDFCHLNLLSQEPMDHSIAALSTVAVAHVQRNELGRLLADHPHVATAARASQFADEARLRGSITNIGRHNAEQRVGYVLCDLWARATAIGLIENGCLDFPPTQVDIADHAGLTAVHVNRMLQRLRNDGLLDFSGRRLSLPDFDQLAHFSGYEDTTTGSNRNYQNTTFGIRSAINVVQQIST